MDEQTLPGATRDFEAGATDAGLRLDRFLAATLTEHSRVRLQELIHEGHVFLNGSNAKPSEKLRAGDVVRVTIPEPKPMTEVPATEMDLNILFEDSDLLVIDKPAGLVVHPGAGTSHDTLVNALLFRCHDLSGIGGVERPGIVHRLDKETSGCLVVAKNDTTHRGLSVQFADRKVNKVYLAMVKGVPLRPHGKIEAPIGRHPVSRQKMAVREDHDGREALTEYEVLGSRDGMSLVACHPKTGRTHQIRVHLKHLGHPILGDPVYGVRGAFSRHLLHAWKLSFLHPSTGQTVSFCSPVPSDFPILPADAS